MLKNASRMPHRSMVLKTTQGPLRQLRIPIWGQFIRSHLGNSAGKSHAFARFSTFRHGSTNGLHHAIEAEVLKSNPRPLFDKILIANRGEVACRIIKTARKLGIRTVAIYSDPDQHSRHVKLADEAYRVGPAESIHSYLNMDKIIEICLDSGAQAIHPGWGFLSERAEFAEKLQQVGLTFIGPPSSAIISMGSKSESKDIMIKAGVPCVPGYHGSNQNYQFLKEEAKKMGFPVLIKAIKGGGGKGMKIVHHESDFENQLASARREGEQSFGDGTVLLEKYLISPRHVEVQIFGDMYGNFVHLNERDCSVQRRHQKIIEEAPAPGLSPQVRSELGAKAVAAAKAVNYVGAGTVEFILDSDGKFYYMEMNTRLQVEHPITEMITRQDLVHWQLEIASGNPLPLTQDQVPCIGHAFEARIYAENPRRDFLPDTGTLIHLQAPEEDSFVRVETGVEIGDDISVYYDPMIAKLVVHSMEGRAPALRLLNRKLHEYRVVGPSTNIEFLKTLSSHQAFVAGEVETGFIEKHRAALFPPTPLKPTKESLIRAGVSTALQEIQSRIAHRFTRQPKSPWDTLHGWRLGGDKFSRTYAYSNTSQTSGEVARQDSQVIVNLLQSSHSLSGISFEVSLPNDEGSPTTHQVHASLSSPKLPKTTEPNLASSDVTTVIDGKRSVATHVLQPLKNSTVFSSKHYVFDSEGVFELGIPWPKWLESFKDDLHGDVSSGDGNTLKASMPSKVIKITVKAGDDVKVGDALVVLEAMKTEVVMKAAKEGKVVEIKVLVGGMVQEGQTLVVLA